MGGWMGVPEPRQGWKLKEFGVWRVGEAAGKSRSRKFHVLCMDLHPLHAILAPSHKII